jgi:hypothetical protein
MMNNLGKITVRAAVSQLDKTASADLSKDLYSSAKMLGTIMGVVLACALVALVWRVMHH